MYKKIALTFVTVASLTACGRLEEGYEGTGFLALGRIPDDKGYDYGVNAHHLSTMVAGVWIDPEGCDHWIIDDGVEGYLTPRLTPDGLPVCSGVAAPNSAIGPYHEGTPVRDGL